MSRAEELAKWHEAMAAEPKRNEGKRKRHAESVAELRRLSAVEAELIALKKAIGDAERWKTHVEVVGDHSHKCKKCLFEHTPGDCGAEDCPRCGFDGVDAAIKEQT